MQCAVCQHPERGRIDYLIASGASMQSLGEQFGLAKQRLSSHYQKHVSDRFKQMCAAQHLASFEDMLKNATEANIEAVDLCNLLIKGHMQRWAANLESASLVNVLKDNPAAVAKIEEWYFARMDSKLIEHAEAAD